MARLVGVDLPRGKRIEVGLTYIYGIGLTTSKKILAETGVNPDTRVNDLTEDELSKLRDYIQANLTTEGDLHREVSLRILSASWKSVATVACVIVVACPFAVSALTRTLVRAKVPSVKSVARRSRGVTSGS